MKASKEVMTLESTHRLILGVRQRGVPRTSGSLDTSANIIWRCTQEAEGAPLLREQAEESVRGFESHHLRLKIWKFSSVGQSQRLITARSWVRVPELPLICWCGGTGRRKGLKIPRWRHHTGSIPVTSTMRHQLSRLEHLPFKQGVPSSSLGWRTNKSIWVGGREAECGGL